MTDDAIALRRAALFSVVYFVGAMLTGAWYEQHCPIVPAERPMAGACTTPPPLVGVGWPLYWTYRAASFVTR